MPRSHTPMLYVSSPYFGTTVYVKGSRVALKPHTDLWARGARFGTVTGWTAPGDGSAVVRVKMDHPSIRRIQRLTTEDFTAAD